MSVPSFLARVCGVLALLGTANSGKADDTCRAVLASNVFNVTSSQISYNLASVVMDEICKSEWHTEKEFEERVQNFNTSGSYADIFTGNLGGSQSDKQRSLHQDYVSFCVNKDASLRLRFQSKIRIQNSDTAVGAWKECVKNETGIWSALHTIPASNRFNIEVHFRPGQFSGIPGGKLHITGYPANFGYECSIAKQSIQDIKVDEGDFFISCIKDPKMNVEVAITTNYSPDGLIGPYLVESDEYQGIERLLAQDEQTIASQKSEIETLHTQLTHINVEPQPTVYAGPRFLNQEGPSMKWTGDCNSGATSIHDWVAENAWCKHGEPVVREIPPQFAGPTCPFVFFAVACLNK